MDKTNLKLVIALARTYNTVFKSIEKSLKEEGLTTSEFGVLELLLHKGKQPIQLIAEKILVTSGTITYVIDKLIEKGLVSKDRCSNDKRVFYVDLTLNGKKLISKLFSKHEMFLNNLFHGVDKENKELLIQNLFMLKDNIDKGGMTYES